MCQQEPWGATAVPMEAHSTQKVQPPRMHVSASCMYGCSRIFCRAIVRISVSCFCKNKCRECYDIVCLYFKMYRVNGKQCSSSSSQQSGTLLWQVISTSINSSGIPQAKLRCGRSSQRSSIRFSLQKMLLLQMLLTLHIIKVNRRNCLIHPLVYEINHKC